MTELLQLTRATAITCGHPPGVINLRRDEPFWSIRGEAVLTVRALRNATVTGCGLKGSGGPFCTRVTEIVIGISQVAVSGSPILLSTLDFLTDGPYAAQQLKVRLPDIDVLACEDWAQSQPHKHSLPPRIRSVLRKLFHRAASVNAQITSRERTPNEQARVMYDNIEAHGIESSRRLYHSAGQRVLDTYQKYHNMNLPKDLVVKKMEAKIMQIGPERVSAHCRTSGNVVDIAPSSITDRARFEEAVRSDPNVKKFLTPPNDPAYHLEFE